MDEIVDENELIAVEIDKNVQESLESVFIERSPLECNPEVQLSENRFEQQNSEVENVSEEHQMNNDPPYEEEECVTPHRDYYKKCLKREAKAGGKHAFYYVQKFRKEWLEIDEFKKWIEEVPGDVTKVRCSWCKRILNARLNDLKRHIKTKKHMILSDQVVAGLNYVKVVPAKETSENLDCSRSQLLTILRDISAMEENNTNGDEAVGHYSYDESEHEKSSLTDEMSKVAKEQAETNKLLTSLINVQKDRLSLDQQRLENEKRQLVVQKQMMNVLNEKLTIATSF